MPKTAPIPHCPDEDRRTLESWAKSRTLEAQLVERARIVLRCLEGMAVSAIARELKVRPNTVIDWRRRFEAEGVAGLLDRARSGKPRRYTEEFRNQVLSTLELPPPRGQAVWGRPGGGEAPGRLGACGVAGVTQRGHLPDAPAKLVREHRGAVCRQGRRRGGGCI